MPSSCWSRNGEGKVSMANKNNMGGLLSQLSRSSGGRLKGGNTTVTNLTAPLSAGGISSRAPRLGRPSDTKAAGMNERMTPISIRFGAPSSTRTTSTSASGSGWSRLLTGAASGGFANALSGALGNIGGLGSLISGIAGLFGGGGKATLPPLERFQLPDSQTETVYLGSQMTSAFQGPATERSISNSQNAPIYASAGAPVNRAGNVYDAQQITQAVKQALLNSSSLNDIIAEI